MRQSTHYDLAHAHFLYLSLSECFLSYYWYSHSTRREETGRKRPIIYIQSRALASNTTRSKTKKQSMPGHPEIPAIFWRQPEEQEHFKRVLAPQTAAVWARSAGALGTPLRGAGKLLGRSRRSRRYGTNDQPPGVWL